MTVYFYELVYTIFFVASEIASLLIKGNHNVRLHCSNYVTKIPKTSWIYIMKKYKAIYYDHWKYKFTNYWL